MIGSFLSSVSTTAQQRAPYGTAEELGYTWREQLESEINSLRADIAKLKSGGRPKRLALMPVSPKEWARSPQEVAEEFEAILNSKECALNLGQPKSNGLTNELIADSLAHHDYGCPQEQLIRFLIGHAGENVAENLNQLMSDYAATESGISISPEPLDPEIQKQHWEQLGRTPMYVPQSQDVRQQSSYYNSGEELLTALGIPPNVVLPRHLDYRPLFPKIREQQNVPACTAFAITAALEVNSEVPDDLSEKYLYSLCLRGQQPKDFTLQGQGLYTGDVLAALTCYGSVEESLCPWDTNLEAPELFAEKLLTANRYKVKHWVGIEGEAARSVELLRQLVAHRRFPILRINFYQRWFADEWMLLLGAKDIGHAIVLVGFGVKEKVESRKQPYFLIRDSSAWNAYTYKIPAQNLLQHLNAIYVIDRVHVEHARIGANNRHKL